MSRKKNFVPIFGSSSRGASLSNSATAGTSSMRNPLIHESDAISQSHPVPNDIRETQDPPNAYNSIHARENRDPANAHSSIPAHSDESVSVDSYAHIQLRRRGGGRRQYVVPSPNNIMPPKGEKKPRLWCYGKDSFIPYNASRRIGTIIGDHYNGPYPNWTGTPDDQIEVWWELFKSSYWWPAEEHIPIWENFNMLVRVVSAML